MKYLLIITAFFTFGTLTAQTVVTDTLHVNGNCGMCKKRIETAAWGKGVKYAEWTAETQQLIVTYSTKKTDADAIRKRIAAVGHDVDDLKAPDEVYENLHGCCKYDRQ